MEEELLLPTHTVELHVSNEPISKLYTNECGCFPVCSQSRKQYIITAYHYSLDIILQATFATQADKYHIPAYKSIMKRLEDRGHKVDHKVLDNEASAKYKRVLTKD